MRWLFAIASLWMIFAGTASAAPAQDRYFTSSDGVRLHYLEAGQGKTIVFVPGWTMPAWIFQRQIDEFSRRYHVIAFDPRGQGDSAIPSTGYDHVRRAQDIADLIGQLGAPQVVMVGWSLGVLDALAYAHGNGDTHLSGLVLIDNSIGEDPPPMPSKRPTKPTRPLSREVVMGNFVRGMFSTPQPRTWLDRLTAATLRTPAPAATALLAYPVPRSYWKDAVYSVTKPVLYVVRPRFEGQAHNLEAHDPVAESVVLREPGHALFVDEPARFNAILQDFIRRRVWH